MAVAVGIEVDLLSNPHRVATGARSLGDAFGGVSFHIEDIELVCSAAAIALFRTEIARLRRVYDLVATGRKRTRTRNWHWQRLGRPTVNRDAIKPGHRQCPTVAHRAEDHVFAIVRPTVNLVVITPARRQRTAGREVGQLLRLSAARWDQIDLFIAVVLTGEGDPLSIG